MKARIIVFAHQKGGVGKTTSCMVLTAELAKRGYRVLVADCDAQASATAWANAAPDCTPFPAAVVNLSAYAGKTHREIQKHLDNYDFILIDCPPSLEALAPQSALLVAHLAIIPLPPSPADLWSARGVKELVERAQTINEDLKAVILPNRVVRTSLSKAILQELEAFGIPLMSARLSNRTAYQEAVIAGMSVSDLGRDAKLAADEVCALTDEVLALLGVTK
jgi:chromosome partitioning protein